MARVKNSLYTEQNAGYFELIEGRQRGLGEGGLAVAEI